MLTILSYLVHPHFPSYSLVDFILLLSILYIFKTCKIIVSFYCIFEVMSHNNDMSLKGTTLKMLKHVSVTSPMKN